MDITLNTRKAPSSATPFTPAGAHHGFLPIDVPDQAGSEPLRRLFQAVLDETLRRWQAADAATAPEPVLPIPASPLKHRARPIDMRKPSGLVNVEALSLREREVLALLARGASNKRIARDLGLSPHTIKRHVANILGKLAVHSRTQAAAWFHAQA